jgi:serine/threonine protein kinase
MSFSRLQDLQDALLQQKLVTPQQLAECRAALGHGNAGCEALLKSLESRGYLTPYQSGKLVRGETDGLRLGPYKLLYRNASGSFARVFRACSVEDGTMIGVKVLRQRYASDPRAVQLFRREGELGKRLVHKNIVPIYEIGTAGDLHYLTMEFVEGGNFRDFLKIRHKFSPEEATRYVIDMAEGLEYALAQGFTHRDLKLSNVLLSAQGVAKLVDFGLAGADSSSGAMEEEVDRAIEYATLERNSGAPDNDPRSDLYFLGAIYFELLTGTPPYPPTRVLAERKQFSRYRDVRPIRSVDPTIPGPIAEIVNRLMHVNPNERYQSPTEVLVDLRMAIGQSASSPAATESAEASQPTLICVEARPKQQDSLREYFNSRGYRVLILGSVERAAQRLSPTPPTAFVVMGDAVGEDVVDVYNTLKMRCQKARTVLVLALSRKLNGYREKLQDTDFSRVLTQPVTLRDIRVAIEELRGADAV